MSSHSSAVILAQHQGIGTIVACACGQFHLNLGAVSLTFSGEGFAYTAQLFREAIEKLLLEANDWSLHFASEQDQKRRPQ
jgi:hypothetical protein